MRLGFLFQDIDKGWEQLRKSLQQAKHGKSYVRVGVFGSKAERPGAGLDNVKLALLHEFGSPARGIPQRSFIRAPFDANRPRYMALLKQQLHGLYGNERPMAKVLGVIGQMAVSDIQKYVRQGSNLAPLAASTVKRKGSDRPLIDTGRLLQSVTYEVVLSGDPVKVL